MIAIRRRISTPFSGASAIPATVAEPPLGAISVPSVRTVVVLPAPLGPRKPNTSPWAISNETPSKAVRSPKRLVRRSAESAGPAWDDCGMGVNLWAFVGISLVVIIAPGPDTVMVTKNAIVHGRRAALGTAVGVSTGLLVWTLAAGIGVAALIRASAIAFTAVKLVGAAYLIWLGVQAWRHAPRARTCWTPARPAADRLGPDFARAWPATLATQRSPSSSPACSRSSSPLASRPRRALLLLGGVFVALTFVWLAAYAYAAARLADVLVRPRVKAVLDRVTGTVLIAFGVRVALERR